MDVVYCLRFEIFGFDIYNSSNLITEDTVNKDVIDFLARRQQTVETKVEVQIIQL